ncbi:MAG: hypothetical protein VB088_12695 [Sphaerochaeta sp.]|nr:hypothetical protein [Sphaerochaeta sp.]
MNEKIRFSHHYPKLHGQDSAKLLAVLPLTIDDTTPQALLDYDTTTSDGNKYPLAPGEYLQLIFIGNLRIPFCTIRPQTLQKVIFYQGAIGKVFDVLVMEEKRT